MPNAAIINEEKIKVWIAAKIKPAEIEKELQSEGYDTETIAAYKKEYKKQFYSKRRFNGFLCMATGAFLGFISCLLTLTNIFPDLFNTFLYGLTLIAVTLVFTGLYLVFE